MTTPKTLFSLAVVLLLFACHNNKTVAQTQPASTDSFVLPEGAVSIVYRGHIYIPCKIDSIAGNMVFDTGADRLSIDSTFYANNAFHKYKTVRVVYSGASSGKPLRTIAISDTVSFEFKNYSNRLSRISVHQLKPLFGDFADGILGKQYFLNQILEINYLHEYIHFHKDFSTIDSSGYVKINLKNKGNRLHVPISLQINDGISIQDYAMLDIGSNGSINLTTETANSYKLSENIAHKVRYYSKHLTLGGASAFYEFRAQSLEIGGFKLDSPTIAYSEDKAGFHSQREDQSVGLLGNDILEHFDVLIDFVNNDLYLKPNSNFGKPFRFSKLGFGYVDRSITLNAWIVTGFFENSNAEAAGLKIDDKIIAVNGIDIHQIPYKERAAFWDKTDKFTLLVLRNGEEISIEFETKFVL